MKLRETSSVELKADITDSFLKTVSAFANYRGGTIYFGISDDGEIIGLNNIDKKANSIENRINDTISPVPQFFLNILPDSTIRLTVLSGSETPYYYKGQAYKRAATASVPVDRQELNRLILRGSNINFEELASSRQDLHFHYLEQELKRELGISELNGDILRTLNLYNAETKFNKAARLLADENGLVLIDLAKFGDSIDVIQARLRLENMSILEAYAEATAFFRKFYCYEEIAGIKRERRERVPELSFREALANALVHRAWDVDAPINVAMYADRIEITSLGGLPAGLTADDYLNRQISALSNPILANVFFRLGYIEQFGTGIRRINQSYRNSITKPDYSVGTEAITVILPLFTASVDNLSPEEEKVYAFIQRKTFANRSEIESACALSRAKTLRVLNTLINKGIIKRSGDSRKTHYLLR